MRFRNKHMITAMRWVLTAILLATAAKFFFHKLQPDAEAIPKAELARICKGIAGCKTIQLGVSASLDFRHDALLVDATVDRRSRSGSISQQIEAEVGKAWAERASIFHAPWNKHSMKVRYE